MSDTPTSGIVSPMHIPAGSLATGSPVLPPTTFLVELAYYGIFSPQNVV
ncbi:MAG: hypothetical protein ACRYGI_02605 [Janthinobacterium lividum]